MDLQTRNFENFCITVANILGYLFTKAIEQTVTEDKSTGTYNTRLTVSFRPNEAFASEVSSTLSPEEHTVLVKAMKLGMQFYTNFKTYIQLTDAQLLMQQGKYHELYMTQFAGFAT